MNKSPKAAIMVHTAARIEDGTVTYLAKRVNHSSGKHYAACPHVRMLADYGSWVDDGRHHGASLHKLLLLSSADDIIADRHDHTLISINCCEQLRTTPNNRPHATSGTLRPGIVKEVDVPPTAQRCSIGHYLSVATGP